MKVEQKEVGRIGSTRIVETRSEPRKPIPLRRSLRIVLEERDPIESMLADVAYGFTIYLDDDEIDRNFGFAIKNQTAELFAAVKDGRVEVELERVVMINPDPIWKQREDLIRRIGFQIKNLIRVKRVAPTMSWGAQSSTLNELNLKRRYL